MNKAQDEDFESLYRKWNLKKALAQQQSYIRRPTLRFCIHGHDTLICGRYDGYCKQCARDGNARRKAKV